jgi:mannosyltransferase
MRVFGIGGPPLVLAVICLAGLLLRLHRLDAEGLWFDELCVWQQTRLSLVDLLVDLVERDVHPPLYQLLILAWTKLAGHDSWALRLPSVVWGAAVPLVTAILARALFGALTAVLAAAGVALNGFALYYSQEARSYSLLLLLSTTTVAAWWRAYLAPGEPPRLTRRHWLYVATASLTLYTHVFGAFLVAYVALAELWLSRRAHDPRRARRTWLTTHLLIAAAFAPWLPALWRQVQRVQDDFWISAPAPLTLVDFLREYAGHTSLVVAAAALAIFGSWRARLASPPGRTYVPSEQVRLAWLLGLVVWLLGVPYAISVASQPILHAKSAIAVVPPMLIVAAYGLTRLPRVARTGLAVAWALVSLHAVHTQVYGAQSREGWREMADAVNDELDPERDLVVLYHPREDYGFCYRYYLDPDIRPVDLICESDACLSPVAAIHERSTREGRTRLWLMRMRASDDVPPGLDAFWRTVETRTFRSGTLERLDLRPSWEWAER